MHGTRSLIIEDTNNWPLLVLLITLSKEKEMWMMIEEQKTHFRTPGVGRPRGAVPLSHLLSPQTDYWEMNLIEISYT